MVALFRRDRRGAAPRQPGLHVLVPIFSDEPYYMLQCDFCYMISPAMFDEFVKPDWRQPAGSCTLLPSRRPGRTAAPGLAAVDPRTQGHTVDPGRGPKTDTSGRDVYRKIRRAGKLVQVFRIQRPVRRRGSTSTGWMNLWSSWAAPKASSCSRRRRRWSAKRRHWRSWRSTEQHTEEQLALTKEPPKGSSIWPR